VEKIGTTLRKLFIPWDLRSGYPNLCSQRIRCKGLRGKVFRNKELRSASLFFSAAGSESCSPSQCALPIAWVKVMRHMATILLWKTETDLGFPGGRVLRLLQKSRAELCSAGQPMAAVPTWAFLHEHRSARQFGTQYGH